MDDTIDEIAGTIASELLNKNPDREKVSKLAEALDSQSNSEGKARYKAALQILEKAYGFNASEHHMLNLGPSANRLVSSILALIGLNLNNEDIKEVIGKFPSTLTIGEENIERKRAYFGFTREEFANVVKMSPSILGLGEENIERRRAYFGFAKEEFVNVVKKFPNILGLGEENIERRREFLGLDIERFSKLVFRIPSILGFSEDNLERRFDWYKRHFGIGKEELVARLEEKPPLYFNLFSSSFYTRVLLRAKTVTANGKVLNDVRDLASILWFNEQEFLEKRSNGIRTEEYEMLKHIARVTDEANKQRSKIRQ